MVTLMATASVVFAVLVVVFHRLLNRQSGVKTAI
jgi:hypothetical protein